MVYAFQGKRLILQLAVVVSVGIAGDVSTEIDQ
jgi:hypothetical protein